MYIVFYQDQDRDQVQDRFPFQPTSPFLVEERGRQRVPHTVVHVHYQYWYPYLNQMKLCILQDTKT